MAQSVKIFAKKLLGISLENGRVSGERVSAILEVMRSKPPRHYKEILESYLLKVGAELRKENAMVEHAGALSESAISSIKDRLSRYYNRDIAVSAVSAPELLAGVRIRVADDVWDANARNTLKQLEESFNILK